MSAAEPLRDARCGDVPVRALTALSRALDGREPGCRSTDPEVFFRPDTVAAVAVCAACPATVECLALADALEARFGVWGGVDLDARRVARSGRQSA